MDDVSKLFFLSRRSGFKVHVACINNLAVQENAAH